MGQWTKSVWSRGRKSKGRVNTRDTPKSENPADQSWHIKQSFHVTSLICRCFFQMKMDILSWGVTIYNVCLEVVRVWLMKQKKKKKGWTCITWFKWQFTYSRCYKEKKKSWKKHWYQESKDLEIVLILKILKHFSAFLGIVNFFWDLFLDNKIHYCIFIYF